MHNPSAIFYIRSLVQDKLSYRMGNDVFHFVTERAFLRFLEIVYMFGW